MCIRCNQTQHDTTKTITFANQSGNPMEEYLPATCLSSFEKKFKLFYIFSLCDWYQKFCSWNNVFEKHNPNINVQDFTKKFKPSLNEEPKIASITTLIEKIPFLHFNGQLISKNQPILKPPLYKCCVFQWKLRKTPFLKLKIKKHFSLINLKLTFYQNFFFMAIRSKNLEIRVQKDFWKTLRTCLHFHSDYSVIMNSQLPLWGLFFTLNDLAKLFHSLVHTKLTDITEAIVVL